MWDKVRFISMLQGSAVDRPLGIAEVEKPRRSEHLAFSQSKKRSRSEGLRVW